MKRLILAISLTLLGAQAQISAQEVLRLSTTTSTENSGLLKAILPDFEAKTHMKVHVISVGTGKALELAKNGDVDVTWCMRAQRKINSLPKAMALIAAT
jgi:tungstate transport system substrate-binding protein